MKNINSVVVNLFFSVFLMGLSFQVHAVHSVGGHDVGDMVTEDGFYSNEFEGDFFASDSENIPEGSIPIKVKITYLVSP